MTINQTTCLMVAVTLALAAASTPTARNVKNCRGHGGVNVIVIEDSVPYRATKYTVTCKDGSTYHRE